MEYREWVEKNKSYENTIDRIKMIKAMEFVARHVNDESVFDSWLTSGVADGDIELGDLAAKKEDAEELDYYIEDEAFGEIMTEFLRLMRTAYKFGGLYCGGVVNK